MGKIPTRPGLDALITHSLARGVTKEELEAQRLSYVAGEAAFGSDADEAAYRIALAEGNTAEIGRLDAEAAERRKRVLRHLG